MLFPGDTLIETEFIRSPSQIPILKKKKNDIAELTSSSQAMEHRKIKRHL